jgi:MFS family permease
MSLSDMGVTNQANTQTQSGPINWGIKTVMLTGGVSVTITLAALSPVLPKIDAALARTPNDSLLIKLLATIVGLTMVIGAPVTGVLVDRIGVRRILILACVVYAAAGTAGLYLESLPALIGSRLLLGLVAASIATVSMTLINSRLDASDRAKWMGGHVAIATIAGLILSPIAGLLGEISWRGPFALYALGLLLAVIAVFGVDNWRPAHRASPAAASQRLWTWFPTRYALLAICIGSITYLPLVYLPFLAREAGVTSPFIISLVLLADTTLTAIMATLFGRFRRPISSQIAFASSFALTAAGMLITAMSPNFAGIIVGMMFFGTGVGWFVPNLMTAAARCVTADRQGRTVGLVKAAHYIAAPLCTVMVEPLTRHVGPKGAMMVGASISLCLLAVFGYLLLAHLTDGTRVRTRKIPL